MNKHSGETDKVQKIKLTSSIEQVMWTKNSAAPGAVVGLDVYTQFVGINSDVSIEISDKSGKKFDTIKSKLFGNRFFIELTVPEKAKEELFAEVKLSKHSLNKKSNSLYLFPPVKISNTKWEKKTTFLGDILKIKADISGLADGNEAEVQIWEHHPDDVHELITKFPSIIKNKKVEAEWEFQYSGKAEALLAEVENGNDKAPQFFYRIKAAEITADSDLISMNWFYVELADDDGTLYPDEKFLLELPDSTIREDRLDGYGKYFCFDFEKNGEFKIKFPFRDDAWWEVTKNEKPPPVEKEKEDASSETIVV
ncbi:MAG: hypothetical protein WCE54_05435 [Ignavibacteriaceae bacterium]